MSVRVGEDPSVTSHQPSGAHMRTPALSTPRRIAAVAGLAVMAAGLTPIAASANPAGTDSSSPRSTAPAATAVPSTTPTTSSWRTPPRAPSRWRESTSTTAPAPAGAAGRPSRSPARLPRRQVPHPDGRHGRRRERTSDTRRRSGGLQHGGRRRPGVLARQRHRHHHDWQRGWRCWGHRHGRCQRCDELRDSRSNCRRNHYQLGEPHGGRRRQEQPRVRSGRAHPGELRARRPPAARSSRRSPTSLSPSTRRSPRSP